MGTESDQNHLDLLAVFHYVVAGMAACFGCFPSIHLTIGILAMTGAMPPDENGEEVPWWFGALFAGMGGGMMLLLWGLAVLILLAGRSLHTRRWYTFALVMAGVECLFMPMGTILGAFTIVVLVRPGVKALFEGRG